MEYKLIINSKNYEESTLENFNQILKACENLNDYAKDLDVEIILCPSIIDLKESTKSNITIYSQHIDPKYPGAQTGFIIPKLIKSLGVKGSLISHSEHILNYDQIEKNIGFCKENDLFSCVCARDEKSAEKISKFHPDFIAVEPKELIGGDISISTAKPELITKSLEVISQVKPIPKLLVGAGVKNQEDVKKSVELGAKGILVASGVVKAQDIEGAIKDLLDGFK